MRYLISFFFFSIYLYGFNYHLKPYKISDGIHCFFGLPSQVSHINGGNMINSCYIEISDAYLVIDSGPTYSYAQEAYEIMRNKKKLSVKYVINTSWDEVHVLGNEFYKERGAKLLGPIGYKEHIEGKETLFLETKLTKDAIVNTRIVPLDEYIIEDKSLIFDKLEVTIKTLEDDENHLYVYIKDKKIVFAGDLIFNNRVVPMNNGRSIIKWLKELDELSSLNWLDIISSHGYMTRRSALKNTITYLSTLKSEILEGIKNGKSREDIIRTVKILPFSKDRFYKTWHPRNVANAYDELKIFVDMETNLTEEIEVSTKVVEKLKNSKLKSKNFLKKKEFKTIPQVLYKSFTKAINIAEKKNKIVLLKIRSTVCKYCDQLDRVIGRNSNVIRILNKYFEVVQINVDYENIPMSLSVRSTPTLIFIRPDNKKVLMKLAGIRALGELVDVLNEAVIDGHKGGYLNP